MICGSYIAGDWSQWLRRPGRRLGREGEQGVVTNALAFEPFDINLGLGSLEINNVSTACLLVTFRGKGLLHWLWPKWPLEDNIMSLHPPLWSRLHSSALPPPDMAWSQCPPQLPWLGIPSVVSLMLLISSLEKWQSLVTKPQPQRGTSVP